MNVADTSSHPLAVSPTMGPAWGFGKFFKLFFVFVVLAAIGGEMMYDGDFSKVRSAPAAASRNCVETFRHAPLKLRIDTDVAPDANILEDASTYTAVTALRKEGYKVADATMLYADKMFYNDRVLYGTKKTTHLLPEFLTHDNCTVTLFMKDDRVTSGFARAVRTPKPFLQNLPIPSLPAFNLQGSAGTISQNPALGL